MDDMFSKLVYRNITPSPQELNHLDLPNPFMFGSIDNAADVAQTVAVQQQFERTAPTEFGDEFDDFSTPPSAGLLKKMRLDTGQSLHPPAKKQKIVEESEKVRSRAAKSKKQSDKLSKDKNLADSSIDHSEARVSLDKDKVVPNVEMRDADKAPAASEEKLSLSKSDLDEIKSYVRTYFDMKFNDLQKLMVDQYTGLLEVVKEGFASFGKEAESSYADKLQEVDRHSTDVEVDEAIMKERVMESEEALQNTDEDLSKAITLYIPPSCATYPTWINYIDAATIDTCDRQGNIDNQFYISDSAIAAISQVPVCKTNLKYVRKLPSRRNRKGKDEYYTDKHADLKPTLDFVVAHPVKKRWFYDMAKSSNCWNDEIDLSSHVENIRSMKVASMEKSICEIMQGLCIPAGIPWHLIDEVYVPINYKVYAEFLSDRHQIPSLDFDSKKHRTRYASLLWDYGVNKASLDMLVTTKIRLGLDAPSFDLRIQR
ncbi:hypothetical protein T459_17394 [Capsicum annuum]|uniref:Uncharacterized protein n=1 Tax=Capsicum annuum TaxID=4072 RepID=A0A2G2ZBH0_CAPAN|nr:hypothetical protein T459_17394 [Capsicum annuum]